MADRKRVAGVDVPAWATERWPGWFAPATQPFVVDDLSPQGLKALPVPVIDEPHGAEVRDTFWTMIIDRGSG